MAMRNSPCQSTGYSPHYLLFGKEMHLPFDTSLLPKSTLGKDAKTHITALIDNLKVVKAIAKDNMAKSQTVNKDHQDLKAQKPTFSVGDQVLLFNQKKTIGRSPKLTHKWEGPFYLGNTARLANDDILDSSSCSETGSTTELWNNFQAFSICPSSN
ncbi:uncharacterized protein LOC121385866 [Gigantopelta aegis]|uniref:uncharacterized protein LOC121385866 n=1 Tax=Gigantopelta aegis TaxID=1735272 RepID=UPI001B88A3B8|nr:uncharacterized protein LOC121385866 [Gigantopelta aegis]